MKNITISLSDELARWTRVEAAKADKSVSRYVADMLAQRHLLAEPSAPPTKEPPDVVLKKLKKFLNGPGFGSTDGKPLWPGRDAIYGEREDELLRRRERAGVRGGHRRTGKA